MEFLNRYLRRMNEADGGEVSAAGGGGGTDTAADPGTDTAKADPYKAEFESLKTTLGQTNKQYQDILGRVQGIQPQLDIVGKMKAIFAPEEKKNPFADGINHSNAPEATEHALKELGATQSELAEFRKELAAVKDYNAKLEYDQKSLSMNEYWMEKFDTVDDYNKALGLVGDKYPMFEKELLRYEAEGKTPPVQFLETVNSVLNQIVLEQMFDTNSHIAKSVSAKLAKKAALQESSVMDGDGYTDNAKSKSNGGIEIIYQE